MVVPSKLSYYCRELTFKQELQLPDKIIIIKKMLVFVFCRCKVLSPKKVFTWFWSTFKPIIIHFSINAIEKHNLMFAQLITQGNFLRLNNAALNYSQLLLIEETEVICLSQNE